VTEISSAWRIIRRGLFLVVACTVLAGGAALAFAKTRTKMYTATSALWFRDPGFDQKLFGSTYLPPATDPTTQQNTNVDLSSLPALYTLTAHALGSGITSARVQNELRAIPRGQSSIVDLVATDPNPQLASRIATTAGTQFVAFRQASDRAAIQRAIDAIHSDLAVGSTAASAGQQAQLRRLQDQLEVLSSLQTGDVELIQRATVPTSPSSPQVARDVAAGAVLGLLIGLAAVFARERFDQRIRTRGDLEALSDLPVLGDVPLTARGGLAPPPQLEAFRLLRAALRYLNVERDVMTVAVVSSIPGEGKTTVASGLAIAAASVGVDVLLIESDLRKPTLAQRLGIPSARGLSELLSGQAELGEAIVTAHVQPDDGAPVSFDCILSGAAPPSPAMLLEKPAMEEMLAAVRSQYQLVVIDTAPAGVVSDAIPLCSLVDGVLVVSALNISQRDTTLRVLAQLGHVDAPVLGIVNNRAVGPVGRYRDYYSYGERAARVTMPADSL
jgi:succinoglycan biosynthesis transport protein ExoP